MYRPQRQTGLAGDCRGDGRKYHPFPAIGTPLGLVHPLPHDDAWDGGTGAGHLASSQPGGFCEYYLIDRDHEYDGTDDGEPAEQRERELKEEYEPPHSPFGRIYALIASGAFTYDEVMRKIPWCVILTMIKDQGRMRKKKETEEEEEMLETEEDELAFFGLA